MSVLLDDNFEDGKTVQKDARGRVAIGSAATAKHYRVSRNAHGQILLTPIVQIAEHEMWLWKNPEALASIRRGLEDEAAGRVHDLGSFAQFADIEIDEK